MGNPERATLRGRHRIRSRVDFSLCQTKGKRIHGKRFVLVHLQREAGPARVGVVVSRKTGGAVVRNRWRRLIRESFRTQRNSLKEATDHVVIVRAKGDPDPEARTELKALFSKVVRA